MKKFFILIIAASAAFWGCKKDSPNKGTQDPDVLKPTTDPLLFGQTWVTDNSYGIVTAWQGKTRDTSIVSYRHSGMVVTGLYETSVISPNGAAHGIVYFGNEVIGNKGSRICQFLQTSTSLAEATGRTLDPQYIEWTQGSTTYNGDTYIIAVGSYPGQRASSYFYKIEGATGKQTFHPLAQTPNGNGYGWYCGTSKGLIVAKTISMDNKATFVEVFREANWIQDYKLQVPGHIYIDVENIFAKDDDHLIVIVDCKREGTPITDLYYFTIDLINHAVKMYKADMPEKNFHINKGAYASNTVYLPYFENSDNKCAYITLKLDNNTGKLVTKKIDLQVKSGVTYGSATVVATNGGNVYTSGEQGGLACYWRNDKLVEIENKNAKASVITDIKVFD
ncbi:hypothetical protein ACFQZX_03715 [Mucilaginibacter litoreus]|uniref:DUF4374 domain-containing protein n=1 Tax=Mucilaginibacter litoreus TaxID=1048221 RepID=A0ABW3AR16_9SPHI